MMPDKRVSEQLTDIQSALLALKPTGSAGFEGLVRLILTALTGVNYRLAASGLQGGMDGEATFREDAISFEAKRYSGKIQRNEVLTKIVDLARTNSAPDRLWVLGSTTEVSTQLASAVQDVGDQHAISVLILDWSSEPLPLLAVAAVATGVTAINFIMENGNPKQDRMKLAAAFSEIPKHPTFNNLLYKIKSKFNVSSMATARSIEANVKWREASFQNENISRERLGQALTVCAQPLSCIAHDLKGACESGVANRSSYRFIWRRGRRKIMARCADLS
ncbi:hypothetical protein BOW53_08030 [Solemya pervernicosa gill symbiont]|uniref:Uncharacterized protein n=1 Tax=Solemya pervernicosa gill symbiont TaxID=642797 RepID=A0A1T2L5E8_9GAMM|nr:hypothetical protein [Solemya pervernicosa gill symbiont]OOZ40313.1 hypothetical protein BOW53_08030 [Solemya pervernicosa gill symbiont]